MRPFWRMAEVLCVIYLPPCSISKCYGTKESFHISNAEELYFPRYAPSRTFAFPRKFCRSFLTPRACYPRYEVRPSKNLIRLEYNRFVSRLTGLPGAKFVARLLTRQHCDTRISSTLAGLPILLVDGIIVGTIACLHCEDRKTS